MKPTQILDAARKHNCTPSVIISALAGGKWPHSMLKHLIRDHAETLCGQRRLDAGRLAVLRARDRGLWLVWSGEKSQPLPLP